MSVFIDTWGWVALGDKADSGHLIARRIYHDLRSRRTVPVTTDYVLDETISRVFQAVPFSTAYRFVEELLESAAEGYLRVEAIDRQRFEAAWGLRRRYADKPAISFTDLTSFVVMRELRLARVLTNDRHFEQVNLGFVRLPVAR